MQAPTSTINLAANSGVTGNGPSPAVEESRRSRKPANTRFKQQQLPAWQPMLTAKSVLPFLVAIGIAFIPIGVALLLSATSVTEHQIEYTNCNQFDGGSTCANVSAGGVSGCKCRESFTITENITGPVFLYYALDNFFQNHRKYVKSRDDDQLMGTFKPVKYESDKSYTGPSTDCVPYAVAEGVRGYAPCGAIARSLFNDTIRLKYLGKTDGQGGGVKDVALLKTGIAWASDKSTKFKNPSNDNSAASIQRAMTENNLIKPEFWRKELWQLDTEDETNNGMKNEDLIVWMRTAAFPSFRKLYRRVNHTDVFQAGLPAGNYSIEIDYNFPVVDFDGRKYVIISSTSWIGGRNPFLGIAYITVGSVCLLLAGVFFFIHIRFGKNYVATAFHGLTRETPYDRLPLRHVFVTEEDRPPLASSSPSSSASTDKSGRRLETIPSSEVASESPSPNASSGKNKHLQNNLLQNKPSEMAASTSKQVSQASVGKKNPVATHESLKQKEETLLEPLGGPGVLMSGQSMQGLLDSVLSSVQVRSPPAQDKHSSSSVTSSKHKLSQGRRLNQVSPMVAPSTNKLEETTSENEVRVRRRQMLDQPVLVD